MRSKGHHLSKDALSHWFNRRTIVAQEDAAHTTAAVLSEHAAQLLQPEAHLLPVIKAMLAHELYRRRRQLLDLPIQDIIYELRQLERLMPAPKAAPVDPVNAAREIRKRWRQLYGMADDDPHAPTEN